MTAKERAIAWRKQYPERTREIQLKSKLKKKYNLTLEDYKSLLVRQDGKCAICKNACKTYDRLSVDHSHKTGMIRELLCAKCNRGLGYFQYSADICQKAANYLKRWDTHQNLPRV